MNRLKKVLKKFLFLIILGLGLIGTYIFYFLYSNDAPVFFGEVEYHVPFNEDFSLDIYFPTGGPEKGPYPVLMYIHGGAWISGSKLTVNNNRFNPAFNELRNKGYYIISPDYTLARDGQTPFPDCIQDVFEAINWVAKNAETYNMDMSNLGLLGESAGGHLAMMAAFSTPSDFDLDFPKQSIHYLIDVYGPTDLNGLYNSTAADSLNALIKKLPASLAEKLDLSRLLVGFDPKTESERAERLMHKLSPINYLDEETIPVLIIHGLVDQVVPVEQSYLLATKLDSMNIRHSAHYFDGVNHAFSGATEIQRDFIQQLIINFSLATK